MSSRGGVPRMILFNYRYPRFATARLFVASQSVGGRSPMPDLIAGSKRLCEACREERPHTLQYHLEYHRGAQT